MHFTGAHHRQRALGCIFAFAMTNLPAHSPSPWARRLGYGGLVPFVGLALGAWWLPPAQQTMAASALLAYSATILSFLGAIHWGLTMRDASNPSSRMLLWGITPSLLAWVGLLLPAAPGLLLVAGMLWVCFAVDHAVYSRMGLRTWLPMRLHLTLVASGCCVAGAARFSGVS